MRWQWCILIEVAASLIYAPLPPAVVGFACGGAAGALGAACVYPFDFVKTILQTKEGARRYSSGVEALCTVANEQGPVAYRGLGTQIAGVAPEKAVKICMNDLARAHIAAACGGTLPLVGEIAAGCVAGCCQVVVTNPLEAVKIRLQTCPSGSAFDVLHDLGIAGLYRGAGSCMLRDGMFSCILFPLYAHIKGALELDAAGHEEVLMLALAGLLAAAPAAALSTPLDVVKTRIQAARSGANEGCARTDLYIGSPIPGAAPIPQHEAVQAHPFDAARAIVQESGMGALFSGCVERVLRSAPQFAVTLSCADLLKRSAAAHGWL